MRPTPRGRIPVMNEISRPTATDDDPHVLVTWVKMPRATAARTNRMAPRLVTSHLLAVESCSPSTQGGWGDIANFCCHVTRDGLVNFADLLDVVSYLRSQASATGGEGEFSDVGVPPSQASAKQSAIAAPGQTSPFGQLAPPASDEDWEDVFDLIADDLARRGQEDGGVGTLAW